MSSKTYYPIGEISQGTLRTEDLLPDFASELESLAKDKRTAATAEERAAHLRLCAEVDTVEDFDSENADDLLSEVFEALDCYAAPYFCFGSSEGDGASFGFFLSSDALDFAFDGLRVADLSEVPDDYIGEVLHVNDHGNVSLYYRDDTGPELHEVWAVV